jgi:hypothetical protein
LGRILTLVALSVQSVGLTSCSNTGEDTENTFVSLHAETAESLKPLSTLEGSILGQSFLLTIKREDGAEEAVEVRCTTRENIPCIEVQSRHFVCRDIDGFTLADTKDMLGETDMQSSAGKVILCSSKWGDFTMSEEEFARGVATLLQKHSSPDAFPVTVAGTIEAKGMSAWMISNELRERTVNFQEEMSKK